MNPGRKSHHVCRKYSQYHGCRPRASAESQTLTPANQLYEGIQFINIISHTKTHIPPQPHHSLRRRRELPPIPHLHPPIKIHRLDKRAELLRALGRGNRRPRLGTHTTRRAVRVLDVEHGLARLDERLERPPLVVLDALLVDLVVDDVDDVPYDLARVLQTDAESVLARLARQELDKVDRVGLLQPEAVVISLRAVSQSTRLRPGVLT